MAQPRGGKISHLTTVECVKTGKKYEANLDPKFYENAGLCVKCGKLFKLSGPRANKNHIVTQHWKRGKR